MITQTVAQQKPGGAFRRQSVHPPAHLRPTMIVWTLCRLTKIKSIQNDFQPKVPKKTLNSSQRHFPACSIPSRGTRVRSMLGQAEVQTHVPAVGKNVDSAVPPTRFAEIWHCSAAGEVGGNGKAVEENKAKVERVATSVMSSFGVVVKYRSQ
jgi:hypothetical protein